MENGWRVGGEWVESERRVSGEGVESGWRVPGEPTIYLIAYMYIVYTGHMYICWYTRGRGSYIALDQTHHPYLEWQQELQKENIWIELLDKDFGDLLQMQIPV